MLMNSEVQAEVKKVAENALETFSLVSEYANSVLQRGLTGGNRAVANSDPETLYQVAVRERERLQDELAAYERLAFEPAIARVTFVDADGNASTYFVCRAKQGLLEHRVVSYHAAVGRMASLPVGEEFKLPNGKLVEIVARGRFAPERVSGGWDSRNSILEADEYGPLTIASLRAFLAATLPSGEVDDLLGEIEAEEAQRANVIDGIRRGVITKMGLRDQPILDQYQDEIFRLPLDKRLLILGPPGTGKTTTLIRRLGQKVDAAFLDDDERRLVDRIRTREGGDHAQSWIMFTPTELLKQYLKEAFSREDVAAPDQRLWTWSDFRRDLARSEFGILRTGAGGGTFVLRENARILGSTALDSPIQWFEDFYSWQRTSYLGALRQAAEGLANASDIGVQVIGIRLKEKLDALGEGDLGALLDGLVAEIPRVQELSSKLKEASDGVIRGGLNLELNRNRQFLDELGRFIEGLKQVPVSDSEDVDDQDADEDEEPSAPQAGRAATIAAYMKAVRAKARSVASKRSLNRSSRNGRIVEWLGNRLPGESQLVDVGNSLLLQSAARNFQNPVKRYFDRMPRRYRAFRRASQEGGRWYLADGFDARDIHPLEVDLILLALMREGAALLRRPGGVRDVDTPSWSPLKKFTELFRNQVLVDEATDFSPIQLACMAAIAHPQLRSFFACGDFNQRLTSWGARSADELKWVFPDFDIREITISYRQTRQLNEFARAIIQVVGGSEQTVSLPDHVNAEGVMPALLEQSSRPEQLVEWLADRILEIERFVDQLPSTAIFVNTEDDVAPLAEKLGAALADRNIQVVACPKGQVKGQDSDVRVFDIQHIKGLEFESVFFVAIDKLAETAPELFDKYLYVGTTRAATYLGITCEGRLPSLLDPLRPLFGSDWLSPGVETGGGSNGL